MTHEAVESLLGVYALDALDVDEAAKVEAHLAECPRCRSEVAAHRNTASLLASVGGEAPPRLWDRIAAELVTGDAASGERSPAPTRVVPLPLWRRIALPVAAAMATAAAAAAVVFGVSAAHLNNQVNALSDALNSGGLQQAAAAAVLNPQHREVQLASASHGLTAQVVVLPNGNAFLVRSDLPALKAAHTYQLWGLAKGRVVSLGLLGSHPELVAFRVDPSVSRLMVTAEPLGGVPQPTTPVLIEGALSV